MSDFTISNDENKNSSQSDLQITISEQEHSVPITQLVQSEVLEQLQQAISAAESLTVRNTEILIELPAAVRDDLIAILSAANARFDVTGHHQTFSSVFEAICQTEVPASDLKHVGAAIDSALAAASMFGPSAVPQAARHIQTWLRRNDVESPNVRTLQKQINANVKSAENRNSITPQDAANLVLQAFQKRRRDRGEDVSTSPPCWFWKGKVWKWDGKKWTEAERFKHQTLQILQSELPQTPLTDSYLGSVITNIESKVLLDVEVDRLPLKISAGNPVSAKTGEFVVVENGVLDLSTLTAEVPVVLQPHDPTILGAPELEVVYDPKATCPLWNQTLSEIVPPTSDHDKRIDLIHEALGYALMPWNHTFEKFFVFHGNGQNGKSLILNVVQALLGMSNISHVSIDDLQNEFRIGGMIGRLANISTEMSRMPKVQEGLLKQLASGESLQVNEKHKDPVSRKPTAKLFFSTNILPPLADTSDGIWRRLLVIPFRERFENEKRDLHRARNIIANELPGVLNRVLEGARRLLTQEDFSDCDQCRKAIENHRLSSDPLRQFLDEKCRVASDASVRVDDFYFEYGMFCSDNGRRAKGKSTVGEELQNLGLEITRSRESTGDRKYRYHGIEIADSGSNESGTESVPVSAEANSVHSPSYRTSRARTSISP